MVNTYVIAPNFSIFPPPLIPRGTTPLAGTTAPAATAPAATPPNPWADNAIIQLGDVLTNPFGAEWRPLNRYDRSPIDANRVEEPGKNGGFKETRGALFKGRLGVWASLLAALGIGADVNIGVYMQSKSDETIEVTSLETHTIDVTDEYVEKVVVSGGVQKHLTSYPKSHLFIVSGLKIAKGAKQNVRSRFKTGADAGAGDSSGQVADMKLLELAWKRSKRTSFDTATDFVIAVRLRRIVLNEKGQLQGHHLSLNNATMEDGTPAVEPEKGSNLVYGSMNDDFSTEQKVFSGDLYEGRGKPKEGDTEYQQPIVDELDDHFFMPDLIDDDDDDE